MNARSTSSTLLLACAGALALAAACEDGARPTTRGRVVDDERRLLSEALCTLERAAPADCYREGAALAAGAGSERGP